jgi:hypothetical protein
MARFATPIALIAGVIAFVLGLVMARALGWTGLQALVLAIVACVLVALGVWLISDTRTRAQVLGDEYRSQAEAKAREVEAKLGGFRKQAQSIHDPGLGTLVNQICDDVDVLLNRVRATNPNTLQSTADIMLGHLNNLGVVVDEYVAVRNGPQYYDNPTKILSDDKESIQGFHDFVTASIKLINQGQVLGADASRQMLAATKFTRVT